MTKFGTMVHDDRQKFEILQIQSAAGILTKRPPNAFVGGPHTRIKRRHIGKIEKLLYLSRGSSDFDEIWHADAVRPSRPFRPKI